MRRLRVAFLVGVCVLALAWNMALSSRRKYFSGNLVQVKQQDLILKVNCPGKIEPKNQETLRSELDGRKKTVYVQEGDPIEKGQLLMEISEEKVRTDLSQKKIALRNAEIDYDKARKDFGLAKSLFRQMAVPRRDVDDSKQAFERAALTLKTAREDAERLAQKLKGSKIYSPLKGIVLKVFIENEPWISEGKELMKVAAVDKFIVRGHIDELDIAQVAVGQDAMIRCDAYADQEMKGRVDWIGAQAVDGAFAEIDVAINIVDNKGLNLKPNLSCEASIITGNIPKAIVIPAEGVRQEKDGAFVLLAQPGGWLQSQPVKVGRINGGIAVIESGLKPTQSILVAKGDAD